MPLEEIETPKQRGQDLESLDRDKQTMLYAAPDMWGANTDSTIDHFFCHIDGIDVAEGIIKDGNEYEAYYSIAALHWDALFHQGDLKDDDSFDKEDIYTDIADNPLEMVEKESQDPIQKEKANSLSYKDKKSLDTFIDKHKSIFKIRLESGSPETVMSMRIALDDSKNCVKIKVCRYPKSQKKSLDA